MRDELQARYRIAETILRTRVMIERLYSNDYQYIMTNYRHYIDDCNQIIVVLQIFDADLATSIRNLVSNVFNNSGWEYILMADRLQEVISLLMLSINYTPVSIGEVNDNLVIRDTNSGFLTCYDRQVDSYIDSYIDPAWEGRCEARHIYEPGMLQFRMIGCDMGYLPWQLFEESDSSIDIYIYDLDDIMVNLAREYGALSYIPDNKLHIIVNSDPYILAEQLFADVPSGDLGAAFRTNARTFAKFPDELVEVITTYQSRWNTHYNTGRLLLNNLRRNEYNVSRYIDDIPCENISKKWKIIAAGPSLDEHIEDIRRDSEEYNIVSVSTALKKLLNYGIRPDYVCVLDPLEHVYKHVEGIEDCEIPVIMSPTANWRYGEYYSGEKYLYRSHNGEEMSTGTTVSTLAVKSAIRLGATRIEMYGLDLAYPGLKTHAQGAIDCTEITDSGLLEVKSVDGGLVKTSSQFLIYIKELSDYIEGCSNIEFINYSDNGAYISGARWYKDITGEVDTFTPSPLMKRYWEAGIKVLCKLASICEHHGICWYADYGTLLGTIRHRGYIPWDDDLDICMLREDYDRLRNLPKEELDGLIIFNDCMTTMSPLRVVNTIAFNMTERFLAEYANCPYSAGVDIYPLDHIPDEEEDVETYKAILQAVKYLSMRHDPLVTEENLIELYGDIRSEEDDNKMLNMIERLAHCDIDRTGDITRQMAILLDKLQAQYASKRYNPVAYMPEWCVGDRKALPVDDYGTASYMQFEDIKIPVPHNYERVVIERFGDDYMVPRRYTAHNYPAYGADMARLKRQYEESGNELPQEYSD